VPQSQTKPAGWLTEDAATCAHKRGKDSCQTSSRLGGWHLLVQQHNAMGGAFSLGESCL